LHYFPVFRTWFGLAGFCKLPWNDIFPEANKHQPEAHKIPEHVQNYVNLFGAVTGKQIDLKELMLQSERVYNFPETVQCPQRAMDAA
jgi:aldehyde:ferredoxin oxidoreductase